MDQSELSNLKNTKAKTIYDYSIPGRKTPRVIRDYTGVVSLTDQHTVSANDLNVLVKRYKPDELSAYLIARQRSHQPIEGHDFTKEPSLQDAMNEVKRIKDIFAELPYDVQSQFKSPLDFVKFVDDPRNFDKMVEMKLMTKKEKPKNPPTDQKTNLVEEPPKPEPKKD